jgi:hypothetical protein
VIIAAAPGQERLSSHVITSATRLASADPDTKTFFIFKITPGNRHIEH